jgi:inosine-uridine nucleoside N-ribohydrolase
MTLYHIDSDMGVDDGLAVVLANRLLRDPLVLSTVFGNVPLEVATRNALLFRELMGRTTTLPVFRGAERAADGFWRDARHVHGEDGLGNATRSVDPRLLERISREVAPRLGVGQAPSGAPVIIIGIGPATNIPRLVDWYGRSAVSRIVLMTGTFFDRGNIIPTAEFNAHCDAAALKETLALGIPTLLVPLDVCRKVQIMRAAMIGFKEADTSALASLVVGSHMRYMDSYLEWEGLDGCFPHDSLAVLGALEPERFFRLRGRVAVELAPERGRTMFVPDESSHIEVATGGELKWARETLARLLQGGLARRIAAH